jgi:Holliday junction DNA helicase RuvA
MIGKVTGTIDYKADDHVLIDAGGVGYVVHCAPGTVAALPGPGEVAALYTEHVVREDAMHLYGFRSLAEREWHRLLTSVQGVGSRVSMALIDALGVAGLGRALAAGDAAALRRAPGVGPKLATRIASELKGKAPAMMALGAGPRTQGAGGPRPVVPAAGEHQAGASDVGADRDGEDALAASADALSALVNLGYDRMEAAAAVAEAGAAGATGEAALIKSALRTLGRNL